MHFSNNSYSEANQSLFKAFINLLDNHGPELISYIRRELAQDKLYYVDDLEVLDETYLRLVEYVSTGKQIKSMIAITKKVAFYVIQELNREKIAQQKNFFDYNLIEELIPSPDPDKDYEWEAMENKHKRIQKAWAQLSEKERQMLKLRILEGLSWQEVNSQLASQGYPAKSDTALRKQGQRAKEKLRKFYESIDTEEDSS